MVVPSSRAMVTTGESPSAARQFERRGDVVDDAGGHACGGQRLGPGGGRAGGEPLLERRAHRSAIGDARLLSQTADRSPGRGRQDLAQRAKLAVVADRDDELADRRSAAARTA